MKQFSRPITERSLEDQDRIVSSYLGDSRIISEGLLLHLMAQGFSIIWILRSASAALNIKRSDIEHFIDTTAGLEALSIELDIGQNNFHDALLKAIESGEL